MSLSGMMLPIVVAQYASKRYTCEWLRFKPKMGKGELGEEKPVPKIELK